MVTLHGTTVSINGMAVLMRGAPGVGKSDLALQLLDASSDDVPVVLVADDQTEITLQQQRLVARAPRTIAGLLEVRGMGLMPVAHALEAPLLLVVDLCSATQIERLPALADCRTRILDHEVHCLRIDASKPSAAARIRFAVQHLENF
jgi:HPr kinase/phosphorylase